MSWHDPVFIVASFERAVLAALDDPESWDAAKAELRSHAAIFPRLTGRVERFIALGTVAHEFARKLRRSALIDAQLAALVVAQTQREGDETT